KGALACLERGDPLGTAAGSLDPALAGDPSRVKVVVDAYARALYFSRAPIPFDRDGTGDVVYHQHVGVSAYMREPLVRWSELARQGHCSCLARPAARRARAQGHHSEIRSLHQRRSRDDVAIPTWRGLRDR